VGASVPQDAGVRQVLHAFGAVHEVVFAVAVVVVPNDV
jgi:hypothetical protein